MILGTPLDVASVGVSLFADELAAQGVPVERLEWRPPPEPAEEPLRRLVPHADAVARANDEALERMQSARPLLVRIAPARDVVPGLDGRTLLHAGPPVEWPDMAGPLRGAVVGALVYEGLARGADDAAALAASGRIRFAPCHEHDAVGPMAGVVSPSMPVWVVENEAAGNRAYCTLNEGLGKVLRYGALGDDVLDRLRWLERSLAPLLADALARLGPLDLRATIAQALQMGDEGHNRNRAGTSLLLRELAPALVDLERPSADVAAALRFVSGNDHFFLNLTMPAAKAVADAACGVDGSSLVTAMSRNGTEFGLRTSGTGDAWFTAPAPAVDGLFLPGYGPEDASLDIGDSAITETVGLGGFALAGAPAIVRYVGGSAADALAATRAMADIAWGESRSWLLPPLDFAGVPLGIDCRAVARTGIAPVIDTGIAHREPGIGQIGAGISRPPLEPFVAACSALADRLEAR